LLGLAPAAARAETVVAVIHVPAMVVENSCNGDQVNLSGDLRIKVTTKATKDGGTTVRSTTVGHLSGQGLVTQLQYRSVDKEESFAYYAPPPGTGTFFDTQSTKLVPKGDAPSMFVVTVVKGTVAADGTLETTLDQTYVTCRGAAGGV
jgi:hypothetical protein